MSSVSRLAWLVEYTSRIEAKLNELFPPDPQTILEKAVFDSLNGGGKRVRSVLTLVMCETFSGSYVEALPVAVAYELAHACALVQDDIIDSSATRRGKQSIAAKYGLSNAILTSDLLLFNVPKVMAKYDKLESGKLVKLFDLLGEACRAATWGEFLDLELAKGKKVSEAEYEHMIRSKTASLISASSASGAIIGGAEDEKVDRAYNFGSWLGMAYQVRDDVLDLFGSEDLLGKPVFTDLRAGKKNLVLIHCLENCPKEEQEALRSMIGKVEYSQSEISEVRELLTKYGSLEYARQKSRQYLEEAKKLVKTFPEHGHERLLELSDFLSERYY